MAPVTTMAPTTTMAPVTTMAPAPTECTFQIGDGTGGTEKYLGSALTKEACVTMVKEREPTANGVTYATSGTACYAEFGMTGRNSAASWQTCELAPTTTMAPVTTMAPAPTECTFQIGDGTGGTEKYLGSAL